MTTPFETPFDYPCDQLDALNKPMKSLDERAYARPHDETVGERLEYAIRLLSSHGLIEYKAKENSFALLDGIREKKSLTSTPTHYKVKSHSNEQEM